VSEPFPEPLPIFFLAHHSTENRFPLRQPERRPEQISPWTVHSFQPAGNSLVLVMWTAFAKRAEP
jgi:hypothetical protein